MAREIVVILLLVAFGAVALWCSALLAAVVRSGQVSSEPAAWRHLLRPLVAPLLVFSAVLGWAVADPDDCEAVGATFGVIAATAVLIAIRALVRAVRALRPRRPVLAGTLGILNPTIYVSPALLAMLDDRALAALTAHERAHVNHRDPARQLLAQFVTDLQWPLPGARRRWIAWRRALELERDDEALAAGVDGVDLAHAIVTCARLSQRISVDIVVAHVIGDADTLSSRVERLLGQPMAQRVGGRQGRIWLHVIVALGVSFVLGAQLGDELIEGVLSVLP